MNPVLRFLALTLGLLAHCSIDCAAHDGKGTRVDLGCYRPRVKWHTIGKNWHRRTGTDRQSLDAEMLDASILYRTTRGLHSIGDQIQLAHI